MGRHSAALAVAALSLTVVATPALAQNFVNGSVSSIPPGDLRIVASPVHMFGPDGGADRTGASFRLGYGFTDAFGLEGKAAFFDGLSLLGGDARVQLLDGDTRASLTAGAHQALLSGGPDSTALDLAADVEASLSRRVSVYGATSYSREYLNGVDNGGFDRLYLVPGLRAAVDDGVTLLVEGGIGLNDDSPSYLLAGVSFELPVSSGARGRR